ncbi:helix-turn-helix domain-containing protein [Alteribacter keqinensis]|uniref:Helix-turn-helix domain-containing protein n=1 Tax=Alteribacter keqinensis TaxID=2483800 RepID=A0A3M7TNW6_9BACI|nr:helix-turn-helix transcriptional regulator [Alteribacter keqinensis]RNA66944.1 helix-turn-helix domain-containing protein [Alteribacter keqinensis]
MNGKVLKYHRLKQRKKQDEVCKGICSVSYYSKIENDQIDVSTDLLERLMDRLDIREEVKSVHNESQLKERIYKLNEKVIDRELAEAAELSGSLQEQLNFVQNPNLIVLFEVILSRLRFLQGEGASAQVLLNKNESFINDVEDPEIRFHFLKMKSVYAYMNQEFHKSLEHLKEADALLDTSNFPHKDVVDLYYMLGLTSYRVEDINSSMHHLNEAVRVYDANYEYHRSGDCRLLLGLCFKVLGKYSKAEKQFELAMKLAKNIGDKKLEAKVLQAKGETFGAMNRSMEAIHHFQMSYRLRQGTDRLITIVAILEQFAKMRLFSEMKSWIEHGFEILDEHKSKAGSFLVRQYEYHLKYYEHVAGDADTEEFEKVLKDEIIPFFEENPRHEFIYKYGKHLAALYEKKQHYSKSVQYYKKAVGALERLKHN